MIKRKFRKDLTNFNYGDFFSLSRKIMVNQIIREKDFSIVSFKYVKFFSCGFQKVSFREAKAYSLRFSNCQFNNVDFQKVNFDEISFYNCQLIDCIFGSAQLYGLCCINCQLTNVYFNAADLLDWKIENSQLTNVWFSGSEVENLKIRNSTLKDISCSCLTVIKYVSENENDLLTPRTSIINSYTSFLREFVQPM